MTSTSPSAPSHFAARAGRWSARHRRAAIIGWLVFVILAVGLGSAAGLKENDSDGGVGESGRADQVLAKAFPNADDDRESVIVQSKTLTVKDAKFQDTVADVVRRVRAESTARDVQRGGVSKDGHSALVTFDVHGDIDETLAATAAAGKANPGFTIGQLGERSLEQAVNDRMGDDFQQAEKLSLPITLVILVLAFGSLVAAFVPLLLALSAVGASLGLVQLVSQITAMDEVVNSIVLLVGLAVGVDYSLFYLRREREERAKGRGSRAAIEAAAATSGHAVLVSGITVVIAMAGMFFAGQATFTSLAIGSILVVLVAMLASVSVLPAILSLLGHRVERGRIPVLGRRAQSGRESRLWGFVLDRVLRRPAISLAISVAILAGLTVPALSMKTALPGLDTMATGTSVESTYKTIEAAFPGDANQATVVVQARDVTAPAVQQGIKQLRAKAVATGELFEPAQVKVSPDRTVASVTIPMAGNGTNERSKHALQTLRHDVIPATGLAKADVSGIAAGSIDFDQSMRDRAPLIAAFVLGLAFLLMLVTFKSIVIPIKAIVLNLLSVGAAYGVLTIVFQHGMDEPITAWLPLFLFVILFGLSMDYHVFILSRIREGVLGGQSTSQAVAHGIKSTAGVVTSAAVVMVAAFAIFATLSSVEMQEMGVGLAAAVLIDATIVRGMLLPSAMQLLGEKCWWMPGRGRRRPSRRPEPAFDGRSA